jgi:hypothetical protein
LGDRRTGTLTALALLLAVLLVACSAPAASQPPPPPPPTPTSTPVMPVPPTPSPSPSPTPVDPVPPTEEPTEPPTPSPSPSPTLGWEQIETEMLALELNPVGLPVEQDAMGDATNEDGSEPREISPDLDLLRIFGGWAGLERAIFGPGGHFDCADPFVFCGEQPFDLGGGNDLLLVGMQGSDVFEVDQNRAGQLAVAFDRQGASNTPQSMGGFGGADLIVVADLENNSMFELFYQTGGVSSGLQLRDTPGRMRIVDDTALLVMPIGRDEMPRFRVVTFERIPPDQPGGGRLDTLPSSPWQINSFFDVTYDIEFIGR